jgi:hypothetical protein
MGKIEAFFIYLTQQRTRNSENKLKLAACFVCVRKRQNQYRAHDSKEARYAAFFLLNIFAFGSRVFYKDIKAFCADE